VRYFSKISESQDSHLTKLQIWVWQGPFRSFDLFSA